MIQLRQFQDHLLLPVRVTPRGGKDCILPFSEGDTEIRLKVASPPEDGKANTSVIQLLAKVLGVPKSRLSIHTGETSRHKQVCVLLPHADEAGALLARLEQALQQTGNAPPCCTLV